MLRAGAGGPGRRPRRGAPPARARPRTRRARPVRHRPGSSRSPGPAPARRPRRCRRWRRSRGRRSGPRRRSGRRRAPTTPGTTAARARRSGPRRSRSARRSPAAAGGSRALHDAVSASSPGARAASRPTRSVVRQPNEPSGQLSMPMWPPFGEVGHREGLLAGRRAHPLDLALGHRGELGREPGHAAHARADAVARHHQVAGHGRRAVRPLHRDPGDAARGVALEADDRVRWSTGTPRPASASTRPTSTAVAADPPSGVAPMGRPAARISSSAPSSAIAS